jgi:hypothetical protein
MNTSAPSCEFNRVDGSIQSSESHGKLGYWIEKARRTLPVMSAGPKPYPDPVKSIPPATVIPEARIEPPFAFT